MSLIEIQKAGVENLEMITQVHIKAFPGFFLTSLGKVFLKIMYAGFIRQPAGICLVIKENNKILGFAAGTSNSDGFFRNLLIKKWFLFAPAAIPGLIRNPIFASRKCLGALFYRGETPEGIPKTALLSSLAVSSHAAGRGFGQKLVQSFANEARSRGCRSVYLTTDKADNIGVNEFYARCGFQLLDSFQRPGNRVMNRWILRFE